MSYELLRVDGREDGHLYSVPCGLCCLSLYWYYFPSPANTPSRQHPLGASTTALPTKTASVPLLVAVRALVDANTACLRAKHFYFSCTAGVPTASVCGFGQCVARVFTPLHCSAMNPLDATFVSSLWAGLHSISSQDSACSATHGLPPATATIMCVHMQPDAAVLLSSASRVVR